MPQYHLGYGPPDNVPGDAGYPRRDHGRARRVAAYRLGAGSFEKYYADLVVD